MVIRVIEDASIFKLIPKRFNAITLNKAIYLRVKITQIMPITLTHEACHVEQQRKYGFTLFLFLYVMKFLLGVCQLKGFVKAYHDISFEVEARAHTEANKGVKYGISGN